MNSDSEGKSRVERPNQPPEPECCRETGQTQAAESGGGRTNSWKRTQGASQAASESRTSLKQSSLETTRKHAGGDVVASTELNTEETVKGEVSGDLPGSKSVAYEAESRTETGRPCRPPERQLRELPGKDVQRQEERPEGEQGIRSTHSNLEPGTRCPNPNQGVDTTTQPAKETSPVRTTEQSWQTSLRAIAKKAAQNPHHRFGGLYRLLNEGALRECFYALRKEAAPGVDGVTFQEYEQNLNANLQNLVKRLKQKSYRARLVRRKYIPKSPGKLRPLGIPVLEDKLVQYAVAQILSALYEADFLDCSYGYRPGRGSRDAVRDLTEALFRGEFQFVVEADIKGFFEHIRWDWMFKMLEQRTDDGALLGLIGKWLRAGILAEDGRIEHPESGTPQGGSVSPVLANEYLHYVLDLGFERVVRKRNQGQSRLFRFADDFVCCFDYRHEAEAFQKLLKERLEKFGLELAPDKTQMMRFGPWAGGHNGRFDFLGFEFSWGKSRRGSHPTVKRRTSRKKLRGAVTRFTEWIRENRNQSIGKLMETVTAKYRGHWNYYGIIGNSKSLNRYYTETNRILFQWLNRRSQRRSYRWRTFQRLLQRFEVPPPRIVDKVAGLLGLPCRAEGKARQISQVNLFGTTYRAARA